MGNSRSISFWRASGWCCTSAVLWLRRRKRVEDDRTRAAGEEAARVKGVQERRGWCVYRRSERALRTSGMARDNGRRDNPDIPYPSKRRRGGGGGGDYKSTTDWTQAGIVLPPSSLLHLLPSLVPPPTPLAQVLRRVLPRAAALPGGLGSSGGASRHRVVFLSTAHHRAMGYRRVGEPTSVRKFRVAPCATCIRASRPAAGSLYSP